MIKLYFIRHGESEWNKATKIQGSKDIALTNKGLLQAKLLAERLETIDLDEIYTSPLIRAKKTAEEIGRSKGLDISIVEELKEMSFGNWEGRTSLEIEKDYPEELDRWRQRPETQKFIGGESLEDVSKRVGRFLDQLILNKKDKNIAIISHGSTIKVMLLDLLGMDRSFYKNLAIGNVSISLIEVRDYNNVLVQFNDSNHLKEL